MSGTSRVLGWLLGLGAMPIAGALDDRAPAWSPGGGSLAFLRGEGEDTRLRVVSFPGGVGVELAKGELGAPVWWDDRTLLLSWRRDGESDLWKLPLGEEPQRWTQQAGDEREPAVAPDGRVAYTADFEGTRHVFVRGAEDDEAECATVQDGIHKGPSWSPDGRRLAYLVQDPEATGPFVESSGVLFVMDLDSGDERQIGDGAGFDAYRCWSPSGSSLAFTSLRDRNYEILLHVEGEDEVRNLSRHAAHDFNMDWSPDGRRLAWIANGRDEAGNADVWVMQADGRDARRLTKDPARDNHPRWSPDGKTLAFLSNRGGSGLELHLLDVEGGAIRKAERPARKNPGPVPDSFHKDLPTLRAQAEGLRGEVQHEAVHAWLEGVAELPEIAPRRLWWQRGPMRAYDEAGYQALEPEQREGLIELSWGTAPYYAPLFDTPLAYARPLDLAASRLGDFDGRRVLDFGYGGITQLVLLARRGAHAVGVDVHPILPALYSAPSDQGEVVGGGGRRGSVQLAHGRWPAEPPVRQRVGEGFDLFLTRNVLKRGFVHPRGEDLPITVDLGVDDAAFLGALHEVTNPGAWVLIYNLGNGPTEPGEDYRYWDDIDNPFPPEAWEEAGFEVVEYDVDDSAAAQRHAAHYGWYGGRTEALAKLSARYSLLRRDG